MPFRYGNYADIRTNYLPKDYEDDTAQFEIIGSVHVEAEWNPEDPVGETRWLTSITQTCQHPVVFVVQARLDQNNIEEVLTGHSAFPQVRGIRHKPTSTTQNAAKQRGLRGSMDDPKWRDGYAQLGHLGYSFDLQVPYWHLDQAADLAADFPETTLVINHTGLPSDRSELGLSNWSKAIEQVAQNLNVMIKISGLGQTNHAWTVESNRDIVLRTLNIFGTDRCMFASNFPVDRLCGNLDAILLGFREIVDTLPETTADALFYKNAMRIYR
ncbi:MAG: amidohydrolase family protein, partial [Gammaproteobacteria bacterium]|nr:amidohydrolase family protein [Gammaproteobacteria bacterium]